LATLDTVVGGAINLLGWITLILGIVTFVQEKRKKANRR
jgi:hypothetical protein